jgi:dGTPase
MRKSGGFEGNGQTLRILARLEKHTPEHGINLSRRALLGVLKYPLPYSQVVRLVPTTLQDLRLLGVKDAKPPKCYLDTEADLVEWILAPFTENDRAIFLEAEEAKGGHAKPRYKALDTSIMEIADDIAYGIHDLEDMVSLGLVTRRDWEQKVETDDRASLIGKDLRRLAHGLFSATSHERKRVIGGLVNRLITSANVQETKLFSDSSFRYNAVLDANSRAFLDVLNKLIFETVIDSSEVQTLEYRGQQVVLGLFQAFSSAPSRMLPGDSRARYEDALNPVEAERILCDYIAGMTDDFAERIYERLFLPNSGSVFERM